MAIQKALLNDWHEIRRFQALALKLNGWRQNDIAEALGVTQGAVSQWMTAARDEGIEALCAHPRPGAPARLTLEQKELIPDFLSHGAEAYGFRGGVWTCARIAYVIEREFGVSYHKDHVSRLLKALKWTPQKPIQRAAQRDQTRIEHWRTEDWDTLKKRLLMNAGRLFLWMNRDFISCQALSRLGHPEGRRPSCIRSKPAITSQ